MLAEFLHYVATPCRREARSLGYLLHAIAVWARHRRCRSAWAPHVAECRGLVHAAVERCDRHRRALVVGSGLLAEVPIADLARRFDEVVLVDMVHLLPARRAAWRWPNIRLVEADVTGAVAPLRAILAAGGTAALPLDALPAPFAGESPDADLPDIDLVISANLLSQLPLVPLEAIEGRSRHYGETDLTAFAEALIRGHLAWLTGLGAVACLFTDVEDLTLKDGRVVEREDTLFGVALPPPDRRWPWDIAPAPEEYPDRDRRLTVAGYIDLRDRDLQACRSPAVTNS